MECLLFISTLFQRFFFPFLFSTPFDVFMCYPKKCPATICLTSRKWCDPCSIPFVEQLWLTKYLKPLNLGMLLSKCLPPIQQMVVDTKFNWVICYVMDIPRQYHSESNVQIWHNLYTKMCYVYYMLIILLCHVTTYFGYAFLSNKIRLN